jgi:hypothetical protein
MLKLFRKIRLRLLDNGNLTRYLIYAFGEILLVVIGILIALQVNNLNENRKTRVDEGQILNDLIIEIEDDFASLNYGIERHSEAINSCKVLLNIFNKSIDYNDSLSFHLAAVHYYTVFISNMGAYESLKSKGLETISNEELRFEIINLYEKWHPILQRNDNILSEDILHIKRNFNQTHFDKFQLFEVIPEGFRYNGEMIPNNFNQLKNNAEYKYILKSLLASHSSVVSLYKLIKTKAENVIDKSSVEIQKLK